MSTRLMIPALALLGMAVVAVPQSTEWKALAKRYDELARNHDDDANRERRYVLLDMFPFRTEKACRKLLKDAWDDEQSIANRVAVVHLLAGSGDTKSVDYLVSGFKKEKARAPVIALSMGLGFTPESERTAIAECALKHLKKAKDDLRYALIEGLGELGNPAAMPWLTAAKGLTTEELFERNLALGRCGGDAALDLLRPELENALAEARLGATRGIAAVATEAAWPELQRMLADADERVVRRAAAGLAKAGQKAAAPLIADALANARSLRTREALRAALRTLLGRDLGHDAEAWKALAAGGNPKAPDTFPRIPEFCGMPVASDRFAVLIDTSRSTAWMNRLERMKTECVRLVEALPESATFSLAAASRDIRPFSDSWVDAAGRAAAIEWIQDLQPGGGFDARLALTTVLESDSLIDTIVLVTDSHPWGAGVGEGSRETIETFRRMNRTRDVRLVIALVMPGGRYESSERSESEIVERIDYLTEMATDSGGTFVNVDK